MKLRGPKERRAQAARRRLGRAAKADSRGGRSTGRQPRPIRASPLSGAGLRPARALAFPAFDLLPFLLYRFEHIYDDSIQAGIAVRAPVPRPDWPHPAMRSAGERALGQEFLQLLQR